jgi:hypothetical protein
MAHFLDRLAVSLATNAEHPEKDRTSRRSALRILGATAIGAATTALGLKRASAESCCYENTVPTTECRCGSTGGGYQCWVFSCNWKGYVSTGCNGRQCGKYCTQLYQVGSC